MSRPMAYGADSRSRIDITLYPTNQPIRHMQRALDYFDRAYVINLDHDILRLARIARRLNCLGVEFERCPAVLPEVRDTATADANLRAGHFGCARSHQAVLRRILERGQQTAVIFEDDAVFRDDLNAWMDRILPQLRSVAWDIFYLGLHLVESGGLVSENLGRVKQGHHTHAYAVSRPAAERLIDLIETAIGWGRAFDGFEDDSLVKLYATPILAIQEPNDSYTLGYAVNRVPQYFGPFDRREFQAHCREMHEWDTAPQLTSNGI